MRALITQREARDAYGELTDILEARYVDYFVKLGLEVQPVSNFLPEELLPNGDVLILTGGGDLPAEYYHETRPNGTQPHRDGTERWLTERFRKSGKPILGICRGMQYINALWGGKISRLSGLAEERPIRMDHPVEVAGEQWLVNQFHNDGILLEDLAPGLKPLAVDRENGVVEAFFSQEDRILALQWHPERPFADKLSGERTANMIRKFLGLGECLG